MYRKDMHIFFAAISTMFSDKNYRWYGIYKKGLTNIETCPFVPDCKQLLRLAHFCVTPAFGDTRWKPACEKLCYLSNNLLSWFTPLSAPFLVDLWMHISIRWILGWPVSTTDSFSVLPSPLLSVLFLFFLPLESWDIVTHFQFLPLSEAECVNVKANG